MCIFHIINKLNREGDLLLREPIFYKTNHAIKQLIFRFITLVYDKKINYPKLDITRSHTAFPNGTIL